MLRGAVAGIIAVTEILASLDRGARRQFVRMVPLARCR